MMRSLSACLLVLAVASPALATEVPVPATPPAAKMTAHAKAKARASAASSSAASGGSVSSSERVYVAPALPGLSSGPCTGGSGGVSTPFGGLAVGTLDENCQRIATINTLVMLGYRDLADEIALDLVGVAEARARLALRNGGGAVPASSSWSAAGEYPAGVGGGR